MAKVIWALIVALCIACWIGSTVLVLFKRAASLRTWVLYLVVCVPSAFGGGVAGMALSKQVFRRVLRDLFGDPFKPVTSVASISLFAMLAVSMGLAVMTRVRTRAQRLSWVSGTVTAALWQVVISLVLIVVSLLDDNFRITSSRAVPGVFIWMATAGVLAAAGALMMKERLRSAGAVGRGAPPPSSAVRISRG